MDFWPVLIFQQKKKNEKYTKAPHSKKRGGATTTTQRVCVKGRRADIHWVGEMSVDCSPPPNSWERGRCTLALSSFQ